MALNGRAVATRNRNVRKAIRIPRSMGSAALALAYVANGRFDAFVQQGGLSTWDIAAAGLIAERAGARVTSMTGAPWFDVGPLADVDRHPRRAAGPPRGAAGPGPLASASQPISGTGRACAAHTL